MLSRPLALSMLFFWAETMAMLETITTEQPIVQKEAPPLPDLLKAVLIIFGINIALAAWFYLSPAIPANKIHEGSAHATFNGASKESPFTELVDLRQPKAPRRAAKLIPVLEEVAPPEPPQDVPAYTSAYYPQADSSDARHVASKVVYEQPVRTYPR